MKQEPKFLFFSPKGEGSVNLSGKTFLAVDDFRRLVYDHSADY